MPSVRPCMASSGRSLGAQTRRRDVGVGIETATPEEAPHPRGDRGEHAADLFVGRGRGRLEAQRVPHSFAEHAVEHQGVEVDVEIESPAEALDHRHAAGLAAVPVALPRAPALEGEQGAHVDPTGGPGRGATPDQRGARRTRSCAGPRNWDRSRAPCRKGHEAFECALSAPLTLSGSPGGRNGLVLRWCGSAASLRADGAIR